LASPEKWVALFWGMHSSESMSLNLRHLSKLKREALSPYSSNTTFDKEKLFPYA